MLSINKMKNNDKTVEIASYGQKHSEQMRFNLLRDTVKMGDGSLLIGFRCNNDNG